MGFGIKKLFKRKKSSRSIGTPTKVNGTPKTPSTEPAKDDPPAADEERRDDGPPAYSDDLPVKNLLDDLNICESKAGGNEQRGDMELVLGDIMEVPDDEPPMTVKEPEAPRAVTMELQVIIPEDTTEDAPPSVYEDSSNISNDMPLGVEAPVDEPPIVVAAEPANENEGAAEPATSPAKAITAEETTDPKKQESTNSPIRPRRLDPDGLVAARNQEDGNGSVVDDQSTQLQGNQDGNDNRQNETPANSITGALMKMMDKAKECTGAMMIPETVKKCVPTADNACIPVGGTEEKTKPRVVLDRQYSYYDDQFALKILDELINVGYALVHHQQMEEPAGDDSEGDWIGRSVTLILRPGICNRLQVQAPYLEWATLGGGQQNGIQTTTISLLDIHSISNSTIEDIENADDDELQEKSRGVDIEKDKEDLQCVFYLTTKRGEIYVMEAITADESQRLVAGIKNLASRLLRLLIAGEKGVLSDFFDNAAEPGEIRLSADEAMIRISNSLLDYMGRSSS